MQKTFSAILEHGVLRPLEDLGLKEGQQVSLRLVETPDRLIDDDDVLDHEYLDSLEEEEMPEVSLEQVRSALAKIPGTMTAAFEAEREDRF